MNVICVCKTFGRIFDDAHVRISLSFVMVMSMSRLVVLVEACAPVIVVRYARKALHAGRQPGRCWLQSLTRGERGIHRP